MLAGVSAAMAATGTVSAGEASAAADAYEIPESQQCIECTGSGIVSCTYLSDPIRTATCLENLSPQNSKTAL